MEVQAVVAAGPCAADCRVLLQHSRVKAELLERTCCRETCCSGADDQDRGCLALTCSAGRVFDVRGSRLIAFIVRSRHVWNSPRLKKSPSVSWAGIATAFYRRALQGVNV